MMLSTIFGVGVFLVGIALGDNPTRGHRNLQGDFSALNTLLKDVQLTIPGPITVVPTPKVEITTDIKCVGLSLSGFTANTVLLPDRSTPETGSKQQQQTTLSISGIGVTCTIGEIKAPLGVKTAATITATGSSITSAIIFLTDDAEKVVPSGVLDGECTADVNAVVDVKNGVLQVGLNALKSLVNNLLGKEICKQLGTLFTSLLADPVKMLSDGLLPLRESPPTWNDPLEMEVALADREFLPELIDLQSNPVFDIVFETFASYLSDLDEATGKPKINSQLKSYFDSEEGQEQLGATIEIPLDIAPISLDAGFLKLDAQISKASATNLDNFEQINLNPLGNYTIDAGFKHQGFGVAVEVEFKLSVKTVSGQIVTWDETFKLDFGFTNLETQFSSLLAMSKYQMGSLQVGPLMNAPTDCVLSAFATEPALTRSRVTLNDVSSPTVSGFKSTGVQSMINTIFETVFLIFEKPLLNILPQAASLLIKDNLNEMLVTQTKEAICPKPVVYKGNDQYFDFSQNAAFQGIVEAVQGFLPQINQELTALTTEQSGIAGTLSYPEYMVIFDFDTSTLSAESNPTAIQKIKLALDDFLASGLNTFHKLAFMETRQGPNYPYALLNSLSIGLDAATQTGAPLAVALNLGFQIQTDGNIAQDNSVEIKFGFDSFDFVLELVAKINRSRVNALQLRGLGISDCVLGTLDQGNFEQLSLLLPGAYFTVACVKCETPSLQAFSDRANQPGAAQEFVTAVQKTVTDALGRVQTAAVVDVETLKASCDAKLASRDAGHAVSPGALGLMTALGLSMGGVFSLFCCLHNYKGVKPLSASDHRRMVKSFQMFEKLESSRLESNGSSQDLEWQLREFFRQYDPRLVDSSEMYGMISYHTGNGAQGNRAGIEVLNQELQRKYGADLRPFALRQQLFRFYKQVGVQIEASFVYQQVMHIINSRNGLQEINQQLMATYGRDLGQLNRRTYQPSSRGGSTKSTGSSSPAPEAACSLSTDPAIPKKVRLLVSCLLLTNVVLFAIGHALLAASVDLYATVLAQQVEVVGVQEFTILGSVLKLFESGAYPLGVLIFMLSIAWPYIKCGILTYCWFVPPPRLSAAKRGQYLYWTEVLGKWSLVDVYFLVLIIIAFRLQVNSPDLVVLEDAYMVDLFVTPAPGIYSFCVAALFSLFTNNICLAYHEHVTHKLQVDHLKYLNPKHANYYTTTIESVKNHVFKVTAVRRHEYGLTQATKVLVPILLTLTSALVLIGSFLPAFTIKFKGLVAAAVAAGESKSVQGIGVINKFSMFSAGVAFLGQVEPGNFGYGLGVFVLVVALLTTVVVLPILQYLLLVWMWNKEMTVDEQHKWLVRNELLAAWNGLAVFVVSVAVASLELYEISSGFVGKACEPLEPTLRALAGSGLLDIDDPVCYAADAIPEVGAFLLLLAMVIGSTVSLLTSRMIHESVENRLSALRGDVAPEADDDEILDRFVHKLVNYVHGVLDAVGLIQSGAETRSSQRSKHSVMTPPSSGKIGNVFSGGRSGAWGYAPQGNGRGGNDLWSYANSQK